MLTPCYHIALLIHLLLSLFPFTALPTALQGPQAYTVGDISALVLTSQLHSLLLFLEQFQKGKQLSQIKPSLLKPLFLPIFLLLGLLAQSPSCITGLYQ